MEEYENYKQQILLKISDMYAAKFMDACRELFESGMNSGDEKLMTDVLHLMNQYIEKYPDEIQVGLAFAELKYSYDLLKKDPRIQPDNDIFPDISLQSSAAGIHGFQPGLLPFLQLKNVGYQDSGPVRS